MIGSAGRLALRSLLTDRYADFKRRLARRLGSADAASDVLHETYLRLARFDGQVQVGNPHAYLLRMALNIASDRKRAQKRLLTAVEVEELWRLGDDTIDPETIVASRAEFEQFEVALSELSSRSQAILIAARVYDTPHEVIAERFGISTRMVLYELRQALDHCAGRLERKVVRRFGPAAAKDSK
jgi:RNA polymerase sigma-70 factor (ECF subfamily)